MTVIQRFTKKFLTLLSIALLALMSIHYSGTRMFGKGIYTIPLRSLENKQYVRIEREMGFSNDSIPEREQRYLSLTCYPGGRLGNQMWFYFTGWTIAQTLGRKFYYSCDRPELDDIDLMKWIFPNLAGEVELTKPKNVVKRKLVRIYHTYRTPIIFKDIEDKYLEVDVNYAQNARYIMNHTEQIREMLTFGANVTDRGEKVVDNIANVRKIKVDDLLCAHIRQTDFKNWGWSRTYEENLLAIRHVAKMEAPRTLFIMGDDQQFMMRLVKDLVNNGHVRTDSFYSGFKRELDMYLAKRLCKTFVITTERTTFGFWLAFIMNNDKEVYYLKEYRWHVPRFDSEFPFPWHAIKVWNGTSTILN